MKPFRKSDLKPNFYGGLPSAIIKANYHDGKFYDFDSGEEISLAEGSFVKIRILKKDILDKDNQRFQDQYNRVLPIDSILFIKLPQKHDLDYIITVKLKQDLFMKKSGNKESVVQPCICEVISIKEEGSYENIVGFEPFQTESLNQVFFQASIRYRAKNKSHSTNIYKSCFLENGNELSSLRF